ncbi:RNA pyrophosphohydrolase [Pseudomonadota bacterium]
MIVTREKPDYLYRKGVGIVVLNEENKIFVGKRIDNKSDAWQMPQGGLDYDEDELSCAFRELYEETGIKDVELIKQSSCYYYYNLPYFLQKKFWGGKYLGQKQKWFLMKFTGDHGLVSVATEVPEFSEFKWVTQDELIRSVVRFKRQLYKDVVGEFGEFLV